MNKPEKYWEYEWKNPPLPFNPLATEQPKELIQLESESDDDFDIRHHTWMCKHNIYSPEGYIKAKTRIESIIG